MPRSAEGGPVRHPWSRLAALLAEAADSPDVDALGDIACIASELLRADGVAFGLLVAGELALTGRSDTWADDLTRQQGLLGEGPAIEALRAREPVLVADVAATATSRPMFAAAAARADVAATFAVPVLAGASTLGVMVAYRHAAGPLAATELDDAEVLARIAAMLLVRGHADPASDAAAALAPLLDEVAVLDDEVQIAAGMVAEQLSVTVAEALVRMRGHAFVTDASVEDVARGVIARTVRLER